MGISNGLSEIKKKKNLQHVKGYGLTYHALYCIWTLSLSVKVLFRKAIATLESTAFVKEVHHGGAP